MLDRQYGKIVFECDGCGDVLKTGESDFAEGKAVLDLEDWRARKIGRDWIHHCPDCAK